jgi:hypothetical protein
MSVTELGDVVPRSSGGSVASVLPSPQRTGPRPLAWLGALVAVTVAGLVLASGTGGGSPSVARDGASVFFVALIATVMSRSEQRLIKLGFVTVGIGFVVGAALQVITHHPLY